MADRNRVVLTDGQRAGLRGLGGGGVAPARMPTRARVLLKDDHGDGGPGWSDAAIAGASDLNAGTVPRVRRRFVAGGLEPTLARKRPDRACERALDGAQEARFVAVACSEAPDGSARWTLRLLADGLARLEVVDAVPPETVRRTLKKTGSSRI